MLLILELSIDVPNANEKELPVNLPVLDRLIPKNRGPPAG